VRRASLLALVVALLAPASTPASTAWHRMRAKHSQAATPLRREEPTRTINRPTPRVPAPKPTPKPKPLARMQVIAREFSLTLSRGTLAKGIVAIELDNFGQDPHDLRVERADSPSTGFSFTLAKPRTVSSKKLTLSPGQWKLYCTLPGHEALGMSARVTVTG
jgi:hypothetical protein